MSETKTHIITYQEGSEIVIDSVYVAPHERRQGKAKEMVKEIIDNAFLNDEINTVSLYAYPDDDSIEQDTLIEFYKNIGFEEDANERGLMYYKV